MRWTVARLMGLGGGALLILAPLNGRADTRMAGLAFRPGSGIFISVHGVYDKLPPSGYAPLRVVVNNQSRRTGTWTFRFVSGASSREGGTLTYEWSTAVPPEDEQQFELCVPLSSLGEAAYAYPELRVQVVGPGVESGNASYGGRTRYTGNARTAFTGFSRDLATRMLGPLETTLESQSWELQSCTLVPEELSSDWRSYLGFASVWIADADWASIRPSARAAILQWVAQGGTLIHVRPPTGSALSGADIPTDGSPEHLYGAGWIRVFRERGLDPQVEEMANRIILNKETSLGDRLFADYQQSWPLLLRLPEAPLRVGAIIVAMLAFAVVVGPVNLLLLAGKSRRHRLFITTPIISVFASLLIGGLILIQDGIGGIGGRVALLHLQPDEHRVFLHQEQISRTGVMLGQRLNFAEEAHIAPIRLPTQAGRRSRSLWRSPTACGGEWFASRSWQAQYLAQSVPSRARVALRNPEAVRAGRESPILLSSLPQRLTEVYYHDLRGDVWYAREMRVGEPVTLEAATWSRFRRDWWSPRIVNGGVRAGGCVDRLERRPGFLYAAMPDPGDLWIQTHPGIQWKEQSTVVIGPCTETEAPIR